MNFIDQYFWVFSIFLLPALYIIVATAFYLVFYVWDKGELNKRKIKADAISRVQLRREILYSAVSLSIFCLTGLVVFLLYKHNLSAIYLDITNRSLFYFLLSIVLMILFHDMYFYWTHRLLHLPFLFKKVHIIHHLSNDTSPFTSISINPEESLIQAAVLPLIELIIPLHPYAWFELLF